MQRALPADVYNIEVDCHHVYEIGDVGVLVHNDCANHMIGRIGERAAVDLLKSRGYTVLGGVTRGRHGIDIIAQKNVRGILRTFIIESKSNSSRLSRLQSMGADAYARNVLHRFAGSSVANKQLLQSTALAGKVRGMVIRSNWNSGEFIQTITRWLP